MIFDNGLNVCRNFVKYNELGHRKRNSYSHMTILSQVGATHFLTEI